MRYFVSGILSTLWLRLRDVKSWIVLLLLPGLILAAGRLFPAQEASAGVQVGVALPESGAEELWTLLEERSNEVLTFILADADTIDRNVAAGRWDCGLILEEDFVRRLEALELDRIITIRIGPGSTVYPLVRETVSACMAQLVGPDIAREYLLDSGIAAEEALPGLQSRLEETLDESNRVIVTLTTPGGEALRPLELTRQGVDSILCWLVSAVILVRMLLGTTDLGSWITAPAARRLKPLRSATCLMAARIGADGILMCLSGFVAMLLLGKGPWGCAAVLSFTLFWLAAAILLAHFRPVTAVLPVCVPFAAVSSLLLSSALVDISLIVPALSGAARWFPGAAFLRVCGGDLPAAVFLLGGAAVCFALSWAIDPFCKN